MQMNCPVIFIVFLFVFYFAMTVIASFVMFRVDLCVTSLFIFTIVVIHMLILDVSVSKHKSSSDFSKLFILLLDLKL